MPFIGHLQAYVGHLRKQQLRSAYRTRGQLKWALDGRGDDCDISLLRRMQYNIRFTPPSTWCCPMVLDLHPHKLRFEFNVSYPSPDLHPTNENTIQCAQQMCTTNKGAKLISGHPPYSTALCTEIGRHIKKAPFGLVKMRVGEISHIS